MGEPLAQGRAADDDAGGIATFLEQLRRERDHRLGEIESQVATALLRLRTEARRRSIELHREQAGRTRRARTREHDRRLSRARAGIRRRRWGLLRELQDEALWAIYETLRRYWQEPGRQLAWCRHWLQAAQRHAGATAVQVRLGDGATAETVAALERQLTGAGGRVTVDEQLPAGVLCEWGHMQLDGTLEGQRRQLEAAVFAQLTRWLHEIDHGIGDIDEPR